MRLARPFLFVALAALVRALVAWRTLMPEHDAAHYLWMADGLLDGDPARLLHSVFHPLFPALIGAVRGLAPGLDPIVAGQIAACTCSALAVAPLWFLTARLFDRRAADAAALCFALGIWFVRHPVDVLSEGPFHLLVACAAALIVSGRALGRAGLCCALAYATRPEGAALGLCGFGWLWATRGARPALRFALGASTAILLPIAWGLWGDGFTLSPKAGFAWTDGVGTHGPLHYLHHLGLALAAIPEAIGYVAGPAACVGLALAWRARTRATLLLALPLLIQLAVVPLLRSNHRFLSGYAILLLPFAGLVWTRLRPLLPRPALSVPLVFLACFGADLARLSQQRRADRLVERDLGTFLRGQLAPHEHVASDMQRLDYFAGVEPAPPRTIEAAELVAAARDPDTRFVVWVDGRTPLDEPALTALGFTPVNLPTSLAHDALARGIKLLGR